MTHLDPSHGSISETISTLDFGSHIRNVELGPATKNVTKAEGQVKEEAPMDPRLKEVMDKLNAKDDKINSLQAEVQAMMNKLLNGFEHGSIPRSVSLQYRNMPWN